MNDVLCWLEDLLAYLFCLINSSLGELLGFELEVPDLGCERDVVT